MSDRPSASIHVAGIEYVFDYAENIIVYRDGRTIGQVAPVTVWRPVLNDQCDADGDSDWDGGYDNPLDAVHLLAQMNAREQPLLTDDEEDQDEDQDDEEDQDEGDER